MWYAHRAWLLVFSRLRLLRLILLEPLFELPLLFLQLLNPLGQELHSQRQSSDLSQYGFLRDLFLSGDGSYRNEDRYECDRYGFQLHTHTLFSRLAIAPVPPPAHGLAMVQSVQ